MIQLKYLKGLLIAVGFLSLMSLTDAKAQCKIEFEFRSEVSEKEGNTGKIFLTKKAGGEEVTFRLYEFFHIKKGAVKTKKTEKFSNRGEFLVFDNLPSSRYLILAEDKNCKVTIGGIEGIVVKSSR